MAVSLLEIAQRFWSKVDKSGTCWLWRGGIDHYGYGKFHVDGTWAKAHRIAYELAFGEIPTEKCVCHVCDIRACVRPAHLFLGTKSENTLDCFRKGRISKGDQHCHAKLTTADVREIRRSYSMGEASQRIIATRFGVNQSNISCVVSRKTWAHI